MRFCTGWGGDMLDQELEEDWDEAIGDDPWGSEAE